MKWQKKERIVELMISSTGLISVVVLLLIGIFLWSALDPISTAKTEELIIHLKKSITIVIVTHNMQQAARISDYTAFMYIGELIEFNNTDIIFVNPHNKPTEDYITGRFG